MLAEPASLISFPPYPSPPSLDTSDASNSLSNNDYFNMGANTNTAMDGIGVLNYQRAIDIARNTEGELDPTVSAYLESAVTDIWARINLDSSSYVMTKDEFAVFNFYRTRFQDDDVAEKAVARFWANTHEDAGASV
jgi:hypothetical protein